MDINDVEDAMRVWDEAHDAVHGYFADNDILQPDCWQVWLQLVEMENLARTQALTTINTYRGLKAVE